MMTRKNAGALIVLLVLSVILLFAGNATAGVKTVTISATAPSTYTDGSAIPAEKMQGATYQCFVGDGAEGPWQLLGQNVGTPSCGGDVNMNRASTYWFTMDITIDEKTSEKAGPVSFFYPILISISPPKNLSMGADNVLKWDRPTTYVDGSPVADNVAIKYYVRVKDSAGAWQYIDGVDTEEAQIPSPWWVTNFNAGSISYPPPQPGDVMSFSVSADYFSDGDEKDGPFSEELVHTFAAPVLIPGSPTGISIEVY